MTTKVEVDTAEAIGRGWLEQVGEDEGGPLYKLTQAGVLRSAIKQVIAGYHGGRGYGRAIDFLEIVLRTTEQDFAPQQSRSGPDPVGSIAPGGAE